MHPDAAETATLRNWMEIMTDLPWSNLPRTISTCIKQAYFERRPLRLEKVKERIIEALGAQVERETEGTNPLPVGPPGVARRAWPFGRACLGRRFMRLSLGVCDEPKFAPSPYVCRRDAGPHHSGSSAGGTNNPLICSMRSIKSGGLSWGPLVRAARVLTRNEQ